MSLIGFHRVLIGSAILFCALFAVWEGWRYLQAGGAAELTLAVVFGVLACSLAYYLARLNRFLGRESS
ncbi:MAG: hypothetical protein ACE5JR_02215 [Gemmatimonadota bacterium]